MQTKITHLGAKNCVTGHNGNKASCSIITIGELLYGAYKSERKIENLGKVHRIADLFPVIEISMTIIDAFAHLKAELAGKSKTVDEFDLLIGATALSMNYSIVTNNEKHFRKIPGLELVNWAN